MVEDLNRMQQKQADLEHRCAQQTDAAKSAEAEVRLLQNRISGLALEQREVKRHWLAEKNDLQNRVFQVQTLHTQLQGTLKKRERDFEKLQANLLKGVTKGNGKQQQPGIVLSAPIKACGANGANAHANNSAAAALSLLKDLELNSMRCSMQELEVNNLLSSMMMHHNSR